MAGIGLLRAVTEFRDRYTLFDSDVTEIADDLAGSLRPGERKAGPVAVTVQHALAFPTWKDLQARGLKNPQKIELVMAWLSGVAQKS